MVWRFTLQYLGELPLSKWKTTQEAVDRGMNDIRHSLVEEGWFGKQVTDDHSSLPNQSSEALSLETTPSLNMGESEYDRVWGEEPSAESLYGEASIDGLAASTEPEVDIPEPEPDMEPEL